MNAIADPAQAGKNALTQGRGLWWREKRVLTLFLLLATLFTGAVQAIPALQPSASAAVSGSWQHPQNVPSGYGFEAAIRWWQGQSWPSGGRQTQNRFICEMTHTQPGCTIRRQFIDGGATYGDHDGQLRNFLLGQPNAPQCTVTGSMPCTGGRPVGQWHGTFTEYDVTFRNTRNGTRDRLRIVRASDGNTFVTTDHYNNFTFIGYTP